MYNFNFELGSTQKGDLGGVNQFKRTEYMYVQIFLKFYRALNAIFDLDLINNWTKLKRTIIDQHQSSSSSLIFYMYIIIFILLESSSGWALYLIKQKSCTRLVRYINEPCLNESFTSRTRIKYSVAWLYFQPYVMQQHATKD